MKDLLNHLEYAKLFILISVGMIALTFLVHILFWKKRMIKFIPGLIFICIAIYAIITIDGKIIFLDDINNFTVFIMGLGVGFVGIFTGLIIGIFSKGKTIKSEKSA